MGLLSMASVCAVIAFPILNYFQQLFHIGCLIHLYMSLLSLVLKGTFVAPSARDP
jgi:hypothetical protein